MGFEGKIAHTVKMPDIKKVLGRYVTYVPPRSQNSTGRKVHMTQTPVN